MENLGAMVDSRYTGFREITDRDVLALHCIRSISRHRLSELMFVLIWRQNSATFVKIFYL